jgi:DNA-binding transcriptional regulator YiaG
MSACRFACKVLDKKRERADSGDMRIVKERKAVRKEGSGSGGRYVVRTDTGAFREHVPDYKVKTGWNHANSPLRPKRPDVDDEKAKEAELALKRVADLEGADSEVKLLSEKYGLKREELARLTGFSLRALAEWSTGKLPSGPAERRLRETSRLLEALSEIVDPEEIPRWLHKRNAAFENMTPLQVIEVGEIDRIWGMVQETGSGYLD